MTLIWDPSHMGPNKAYSLWQPEKPVEIHKLAGILVCIC